jgi:glycosyltransferase involved in cell wall biosynthesis
MKIWLRVPSSNPIDSWSIVYRELVHALRKNGNEIFDNTKAEPEDTESYIELWWGDPAFWTWSDCDVNYKVGYALSEARSIQTHGRWKAISNLQQCNLLCCPTFHASMAYLEAPLDIPIEIIPFGVNTLHYQFVNRDNSLPFKFLHYGVAQFRKGSWLAPEAFIKTFKRNEPVKLTISSLLLREELKVIKKEYGNHPNIDIIAKEVPDPFEVYSNHRVLISPHLSEGWGMCITEAMATGMSCLISRCSSPLEYFKSEYGWWVEMSEDYVPLSTCLEGTNGFWRLPDIDSLCEQMRYIFEHPYEVDLKGRAASEYIQQNYTWDLTAKKLVNMIDKHINQVTSETVWK